MTDVVPAAPPRFRRPLPPLRALWAARQNMIGVWAEGAFAADILRQRFLFKLLFICNSPEAVRHVLVSNADNYQKSKAMLRALRPLVGDGMFISHGETWKRQRRIAIPAFHINRIREFSQVMTRSAAEMVGRWGALGPDAEVEMTREMTHVTAEVVTRTMFSDDLGDRVSTVYDGFTEYQETLSQVDFGELLGLPSWWPRLPSPKAKRAVAKLDSVINDIIDTRRESGADRGDLLSILLNARDPETGEPMTPREIRDEVSVIFLAGHETTANSLSWVWYLLSQHPEAEARMHEEIDRVCGDRPPAFDDVQKLVYTRWVFDEALRLYPPVAILSREAQADDEIMGQPVPAGAMVIIAPWLIHRHKGLWRRADMFEPERFSPERAKGRSKYTYLPFGAGPRTCLGASFAMTESTLIMATVAQRFRPRLRPGHPVEPVCRLTLRPRHGLPIRLERR